MTDHAVFTNQTAAYYTLGCKLNFAETTTIGRSLLAQGVRTARPGEVADICVINTCSVTEQADRRCRAMIRKARREHPEAFVVVTGCYAQLSPEEIGRMEGVHLVLGGESKLDVSQYLGELKRSSTAARIIHSPTKDIRTFRISSSSDERTRHFLKVQDGCDYRCTYCTIPKARGRSRSGSIAEIVEEAQRIASTGGDKEIVLTGVNIGDFGRGNGETFLGLLQALDEVEGIERFRIGSVEPNLLTEEIIAFIAHSRRIAPHFHIPLQSGSDEVLRLMKRHYDSALFRSRVELIRHYLPHAFIGIDVIVGMRGETPEFFEESYTFLQSIPFSQLHVFSYSEREGTPALSISYIVPPQEKHKRSQRLMRLSEERLRAFYQAQVGRPARIIWEQGNYDGLMLGHSENYVRIAQPYDALAVGSLSILTPQALHDSGTYLY